jgi:hypothetical protein
MKTNTELMRELMNRFRLDEEAFGDVDWIRPSRNGGFLADGLDLTSLKGCPDYILGSFNIAENQLHTLEFGPKIVDGTFNCSDNPLENFLHGPVEVKGSFFARCNKLRSYEGAPKFIGGNCIVAEPLSRNFSGFYKYFPEIHGQLDIVVRDSNISNVLSLFMVKGLTSAYFVYGESSLPGCDILNEYLAKGKSGLLSCKSELIKAGYSDWAKL